MGILVPQMNDRTAVTTPSGNLPLSLGRNGPEPRQHKSTDLHDFTIIGRLLRNYLQRRWNRLGLAAICMVVTAGMNGVLAWLLDPAIKHIFIENDAKMLPIITVAIAGVVALRAVASFGEQYTLSNL